MSGDTAGTVTSNTRSAPSITVDGVGRADRRMQLEVVRLVDEPLARGPILPVAPTMATLLTMRSSVAWRVPRYVPTPVDDPVAAELLDEYFASRDLGFTGGEYRRRPDPAAFVPPAGTFLVVFDEDDGRLDAAACGCCRPRAARSSTSGSATRPRPRLGTNCSPSSRSAPRSRRPHLVLDTNATLEAAQSLYRIERLRRDRAIQRQPERDELVREALFRQRGRNPTVPDRGTGRPWVHDRTAHLVLRILEHLRSGRLGRTSRSRAPRPEAERAAVIRQAMAEATAVGPAAGCEIFDGTEVGAVHERSHHFGAGAGSGLGRRLRRSRSSCLTTPSRPVLLPQGGVLHPLFNGGLQDGLRTRSSTRTAAARSSNKNNLFDGHPRGPARHRRRSS